MKKSIQDYMGKKYAFIIALPRSGSTLLAFVLDSHSQIFVGHEDHAFPFCERPDRDIYNLKWKINKNFSDYLNQLPSGEKKVIITSRYFKKQQIELITKALGENVRFIILTRKYMWRVFYKANGGKVILPLKDILHFLITKRFIKNNYKYIEISYSEMTSLPENVFSRICKFLGLKFEKEMLDYGKFRHETRGNEKTRKLKRIIDKSKQEKFTLGMTFSALFWRSASLINNLRKKLFYGIKS